MVKNKKLVYIVNYIGVQDNQHYIHIINLIKKLEKYHEWNIKLLSEKGGYGHKKVLDKEVTYLSQKSKISRIIYMIYYLTSLRIKGYRLVFVRISKTAAIITSTYGRLIGLKLLYWQSTLNYDIDRNKPTISRLSGDIIFKIIKNSSFKFVTGPEYMVKYYNNVYNVKNNKILLLYNDIDTKRFNVIKKENTSNRIIHIHSLSPVRKTTMYFPYIIEKLNEYTKNGKIIYMDIIGDGDEKGNIEDMIEMANDNVIINMLGSVPNMEVQKYLNNSSVFIMPTYREGMPRALMEAMACGLPAVCTNAGGTLDLVGNMQKKYVVSRDEPEKFANKLIELLNNEDDRKMIGQENLKIIQRYSTENIAKMYDVKLSKLL